MSVADKPTNFALSSCKFQRVPAAPVLFLLQQTPAFDSFQQADTGRLAASFLPGPKWLASGGGEGGGERVEPPNPRFSSQEHPIEAAYQPSF